MQIAPIAIVDDDVGMREALTNLLESFGFSTSSFGDAESCLESTVATTAACVISDIQLPRADGFSLLRQLRQKKSFLPVILMTAYFTSERLQESRRLGAVCLLRKPFSADALLMNIRRATDGRPSSNFTRH